LLIAAAVDLILNIVNADQSALPADIVNSVVAILFTVSSILLF